MDKDKDKDLFIGPQEFVVGYSKAPVQPQSSARPICHSHAMTRTGREPATIRTAAYIYGARHATHCATGDDMKIWRMKMWYMYDGTGPLHPSFTVGVTLMKHKFWTLCIWFTTAVDRLSHTGNSNLSMSGQMYRKAVYQIFYEAMSPADGKNWKQMTVNVRHIIYG